MTQLKLPLTYGEQGKRFPVIEIFGPTIQGEGPEQGVPCMFVRFGLCDYKCVWCDSMHAVDPEQVKKNATYMTASEIDAKLRELDPTNNVSWVILSGGNPLVHNLRELVNLIHDRDGKVGIETQGTVWKPWADMVDRIVISPKPPSSGNVTTSTVVNSFIERCASVAIPDIAIKIVAFDDADLDYAEKIFTEVIGMPLFYLSIGTDLDGGVEGVLERHRQILAKVFERMKKPHSAVVRWHDVSITPQIHFLLWGHQKGH